MDPPQPRPYGASGQDAIELCKEWMVYLGATDVLRSPEGAGLAGDLYSSRYLAWVSDERGNLGTQAVDDAANVAASDGRMTLIFVPGGVRPIARERADALGVALLHYRATDGVLEGANLLGRQVCVDGLVNR